MELTFRSADRTDGAPMWRFVQEAGVLELNTAYSYVLLCEHFGHTCMVAEDEQGEMMGFVLSYIPPRQPDTVFVWQVGVSPKARGKGLGRRLLDAVVALPACADVRFMEATVSPDNEPSQKLFRSFARRRDAACEESEFFTEDLFPGEHEPEHLFRIGPFEPA